MRDTAKFALKKSHGLWKRLYPWRPYPTNPAIIHAVAKLVHPFCVKAEGTVRNLGVLCVEITRRRDRVANFTEFAWKTEGLAQDWRKVVHNRRKRTRGWGTVESNNTHHRQNAGLEQVGCVSLLARSQSSGSVMPTHVTWDHLNVKEPQAKLLAGGSSYFLPLTVGVPHRQCRSPWYADFVQVKIVTHHLRHSAAESCSWVPYNCSRRWSLLHTALFLVPNIVILCYSQDKE